MSRHRWTKHTSALAHAAKERRRLAGPPPDQGPPRIAPGTVLHTLRVESHLAGVGFEVVVRQAPRRNQIIAETFGRRSRPHGLDWLVRHLRRKLLT